MREFGASAFWGFFNTIDVKRSLQVRYGPRSWADFCRSQSTAGGRESSHSRIFSAAGVLSLAFVETSGKFLLTISHHILELAERSSCCWRFAMKADTAHAFAQPGSMDAPRAAAVLGSEIFSIFSMAY